MNRIKELRLRDGMKQAALADLLQVNQQAISKYELEQIDLDTVTIRRLCEIFGVTADYLLGFSSVPTASVSEEDAALTAAYHAAPESVRQGIDALLAPFMGEASRRSAVS